MSPRSPLLDQRVALFVLALMLPEIECLIVRVTAARGDHQGGHGPTSTGLAARMGWFREASGQNRPKRCSFLFFIFSEFVFV
jgi:hypothetical protein